MKRLLLAAALLLLAIPCRAADSVTGLVEAYDSPTLGASVAAANIAFESGHLKITLHEGSAAPVMAGAGQIGIYFKGKGTLEYLSVDPLEAAVLETNARKATGLKVESVPAGKIIRDTFTDLDLRVSGRPLPPLADSAGAALAPSFAEHREVFSRDRRIQPAFLFAKQKLDAPTTPLVRAEFRGGRETLAYVYDAVSSKTETLYSLHRYRDTTIREYQRALWPVVLSEQLIGQSRKKFLEPPFLLTDITYTLTASEKDDASLAIVETIEPRSVAQQVFRFDMNSVFYDGNRKARHYYVRKVTDESGKDLPFVHREGELVVGTPAPLPANRPHRIRFEIDGDFLFRPSGDNYWALGTEAWFPQPPLNGQYYTIHSTVKVKKPFVPFAPGTTVRRAEEGEYNVVENKIDKPVQFAVVLAGKYAFEEEERNGLKIRVASYAGRNSRAVKQLTNLAFTIVEFYQPFLGPFPFKEFNIIEINELGFGQAPPATMFITREAFNPLSDRDTQAYSKGINHRFAHEIAHQYWGHVVKMGSVEEQWVTESFSEYCAALLSHRMRGPNGMKYVVNEWKTNAREARNSSSIATANRLADYGDPQTAFMHRTWLVYDKGAYVLSKLHEEIGDQAFLTFLRNVQGLNAWRFATTDDMITLLKKLTQRDFTSFFEQNFWGTALP